MAGLREQVSLLRAHGHVDAAHYPLGMLGDEVRLVVKRVNGAMASEAVLLQLAVSSMFDKKAAKLFQKTLKRLNGD